jgi:hypothetical protein
MNVPLTIATTDYDHFRDFRLGLVRAEGIDATWLTLGHHKIFSRFTFNREWNVSELSFAKFAAQVTRLILPPLSEGSREVAARVARARDIQVERYAALGLTNVRTNAQAHGPVLEEIARADGTGLALVRDAADSMRLSARGYHRVLRVARTLADLDGAEKVGRVHLAEALSYRALADELRRAA